MKINTETKTKGKTTTVNEGFATTLNDPIEIGEGPARQTMAENTIDVLDIMTNV
jgi:hypothetical protein